MDKAIDYALWKKWLWRFTRVFLATFLLNVGTNLPKVEKIEDLMPLVIVPAASAAVSATFMALREAGARQNYDSLLHKLPL